MHLGWDFDDLPNTADEEAIVDAVMNFFTGRSGGSDVPWLSENPVTGTLAADTGQVVVDVTLDASLVGQPGDYYATLDVVTDDPVNMIFSIPVTMTVTAAPTGALTGAVTDSATGDPIEWAVVEATYSPFIVFTGTTDSLGGYQMVVPAFAYTVTASASGYAPAQITGVAVSAEATTTLDISLDPLPTCVVSGTVTDAAAGWPLYASIDVNAPGLTTTVWTDPVTGYYSITLAQETLYTFNVNAWAAGYAGTSSEVGPLTGDATEDFGVQGGCGAPGYIPIGSGSITESFEGSFPPLGWTVVDHEGSGVVWDTCSYWGDDNYTGGSGDCAGFNSDTAGSGVEYDTSLVSPVFNDADVGTLTYLANYQNNFAQDYLDVDISTDGGATWTTVLSWNEDHGSFRNLPGEAVAIDLTPYLVGTDNNMIRWRHYDPGANDWNWYAQIDDVGMSFCGPTAGGLVVGNVYDDNTLLPIDNATVENDVGETSATAGGGFYTLFSPAGAHTFTATMPLYNSATATPTAVQSDTVRQDLYLGAGYLIPDPAGVEATLELGANATQPFTLTNSGGISASFALVERMAGSPADIPWLSEDPISGTLPVLGNSAITITFDANVPQIERPGIYMAELEISHDTLYVLAHLPVTLTVTAAPTWGALEGVVIGLGRCDADPGPLEGAEITIEAAGGTTWMLTTGANGAYDRWLDETFSPVTVTVTYPEYESGLATNVPITGGVTTTLDFSLRRSEPCVSAAPAAFSATLELGQRVTRTLTLSNSGAISTPFALFEAIKSPAGDLFLSQPLSSLNILAYASESANDFLTGFDLGAPEVLPNLGPFNPADIPGAGEYVRGYIYVADTGNNLYQLDPATGAVLSTIPVTPPPGSETYSGMALDPTSGLVYASSADGYDSSSLFILEVKTGAATLIGPITNSPCNTAIAIDGGGQMYGYDICTDQFMAIDKTTGAGTNIGSIGFNANFAQGMAYDPASGLIYLAAFNSSPYRAELRVADTSTGNTTLVGVLGSSSPGGLNQLPWLGIPIVVDVPWLSEDPVAGALPADTGVVVVDVTLDASFVSQPGDYYATLEVVTDDPVNRFFALPVTLTVTAAPTGALTGAVTDSATGDPIEGAVVEATYSPFIVFTDTTDSLGGYQMVVPTFAYTVTASIYGYAPALITDVIVSAGATTTLDIPLDPLPTYVVSGTVTDAAAGWPLYASIDIDGYPGDPVWTDPETGYYSITLAHEITYTFNVAAWAGGYPDTSSEVGPLTGDATEDFMLRGNCKAPGYAQQGILAESFEGPFPPTGWTVVDHEGGGVVWDSCINYWGDPNYTGGSGDCAGLNSDTAGDGVEYDTSLVSPVLTDAAVETLTYLANYQHLLSDFLDVDMSTDGGATWTTVLSWNEDHGALNNPPGEAVTIDLIPYLAGTDNNMIRWRHYDPDTNDWNWYAQIDDVSMPNCEPTPGGLVVGNVYDQNTLLPIDNATVENDVGETITTSGGGFYTLFSPAVAHTFSATMPLYNSVIATPTVVQSDTVRQDFVLGAGILTYAPANLEATLALGASATQPFTLTNIGSAGASFVLVERAGGSLADVGWLSENPISDTLPVLGNSAITITFDANAPQVERPGVYTAEMGIDHDTPYGLNNVPVTLTVTAAPAWGVLAGTITSLGHCDADPGPLAGAEISIEAAGGLTWTVSTDTGGAFDRWLDQAHGPVTVTVTHPEHESGLATNVPITAGVTTTLDFSLRWLEPCVSAAPTSYDKIVLLGDVLSDTLDLSNDGALSTTFDLVEMPDMPWLSENPVSGTIDADSVQVVDLLFGSGITQTGHYSGELRVFSDDPVNGIIPIPVDLMVVVSGTAGVELGPDSLIVAAPGDAVTHTFVLSNSGDVADFYDLVLTGNAWATTAPNESGYLAPSQTLTVTVVVAIPVDPMGRSATSAIIGSDTFTLTAVSRLDGVSASASGTTLADVATGVAVDPPVDAAAGDPGSAVVYTLVVTNSGAFTDSFDLTATNVWPAAYPATVGPLAMGAAASVDVTVTVPLNTPGGASDGLTLTLTSQIDPTAMGQALLSTTANEVGPVSDDDAFTVAEDSAANALDVLAGDTDDNGDTLLVFAVGDPPNGSVVNGSTVISYTPDADFFGSDIFTYTVSDGNGGYDTAVVTVTVDNVNDPPVADDDTFNVDEDSADNPLDVLAGDSDVEGDTLTISAIGALDNGGAAVNGGTVVTYTPLADFYGTETFTYTVSDGNGGTDTATVTVTEGVIPTVTLMVTTGGTGSGTVTPTVGAHVYDEGEVVTLTATPDAVSEFIGWSGGLVIALNPVTITMTQDITVTANFDPTGFAIYLPLVVKNH